MKHLNKIFSIVLTAAIAASLLVMAIPVSAADNAWAELKVPTKTNLVAPNTINASGLLTKAIDGTLYAYINDTGVTTSATNFTQRLAKSTNGGRTWTSVSAPAAFAIDAIACSPQEANVVYIAVNGVVYKSIDSGATFTANPSTVTGAKFLAVSLFQGSYKIFAGTDTNVLIYNEGVTFQNPGFTTFEPLTVTHILDLKLSPTFTTDTTVLVLATNGTQTLVYTSNGSQYGTPAEIGNGLGASFVATAGEIGFSTDFNATSLAVFFAVAGNGTAGGLYRVTVGAALANNTQLKSIPTATNLDITGSGVFAGPVNIFIGTSTGATMITANAGKDTVAAATGFGAGNALVALKADYATSGMAYVLQVAGAANDESGFYLSSNKAGNFVGVGLLNTNVAAITSTAFAPNGDIFMAANDATPSGTLWRNIGGNWEFVAANQAAGSFAMLSVSPNYATDKGVFYVATNVIQFSSDSGLSFDPQSYPATAGTFSAYVVLDSQTFVVAASDGIFRTTLNGFVWTKVNTSAFTILARSSDGTALAAVDASGKVSLSSDLGATWKAVTFDSTNVSPTTVVDVTFQNGSNTVIFALNATGVFKLDTAATTVKWSTNKVVTGAAAAYDSPITSTLTGGVDIVAGVGATSVIYALDGSGSLTRLLGDDSRSGEIAAPAAGATKAYIVPAAGANKVWAVTANQLWSYTDTLAVAVPSVTVTSFTTTTANVTFGTLAAATDYIAVAKVGTTAAKDVYTAGTGNIVGTVDVTAKTVKFSGTLAADTTYTVSVFAIAPVVSLAGTATFSTQPNIPTQPTSLVPEAGATNVPVTPSFQWAANAGATKYELQVSTKSDFSVLVGSTVSTTIPAYAWTTPVLSYGTPYYWQVRTITATGTSNWVTSVFTTTAAPVTNPTTGPGTTTITNTTVTIAPPAETTPAYIWAIIGIGALLVIVVIVLIVRTRRVA